jgi:hypothetical protein
VVADLCFVNPSNQELSVQVEHKTQEVQSMLATCAP